MPLKGIPIRFFPRGVTDTLDATDSPPGAMKSLANLIADPSTPNTFQCRPAAVNISSFPGFSSPETVSAAYQLGTVVYGLIASSRFVGKDEPFAYDVPTDTFLPVSGVSDPVCPATQSLSGDWVPPTMDIMGIYLMVTHPGFASTTNFFGWFNLTNPAAPAWNAGNTTTHILPSVPVSVGQFNNRAYFGCGSALYYTDALTLNITNASQILTIPDGGAINAMVGLPVSTTSQGVLQALLAFTSKPSIWQVTGDAVTSDLALNNISKNVGTFAPRSVVQTPRGVRFMANDGIRMIDLSPSLGDPDSDLRMPFINALLPSRVSAAYNTGVYRICVQNGNVPSFPFEEYWYDEARGIWTGPHTFRHSLAVQYSDTFILFSDALPAQMWESDVLKNGTSVYVENGVQLAFNYTPSILADLDTVYAYTAILTTINLALLSDVGTVTVIATDSILGILSQVSLVPRASQNTWGSVIWGFFNWTATISGLIPYNIPWTQPLVFSKLLLQFTGNSGPSFRIGNLQMMVNQTGYIQ